jgi:hypothetical protein
MAAILEPAHSDRSALVISDTPTTATASAVSWGAIFAGAAAGAALSLILLILGVGLGLSTVSPWSGANPDAKAIGLSTIAWVTFTQLAASALGGYLAGRLRTKWADTLRDEVYFRDTAHGLLTWAVATLLSAAFLTSTISTIVSAGATTLAGAGQATATVTAAAASAGARGADDATRAMNGYYIDLLFRTDAQTPSSNAATNAAARTEPLPANDAQPNPPPANGAPPASSNASAPARAAPLPLGEVARIVGNGVTSGSLPDDDVHYLGRLVAERTGMSQQDAEQRVHDVFARLQGAAHDAANQAKAAAETARQASAYAALWLFIALLIGAFVASFAATHGGRQRDL